MCIDSGPSRLRHNKGIIHSSKQRIAFPHTRKHGADDLPKLPAEAQKLSIVVPTARLLTGDSSRDIMLTVEVILLVLQAAVPLQ